MARFEKLISRISHIIKLYLLSHFVGCEFVSLVVSEQQQRAKVSRAEPKHFLIIQSPHEIPETDTKKRTKRTQGKNKIDINFKVLFYRKLIFTTRTCLQASSAENRAKKNKTMIIKLAANKNEQKTIQNKPRNLRSLIMKEVRSMRLLIKCERELLCVFLGLGP